MYYYVCKKWPGCFAILIFCFPLDSVYTLKSWCSTWKNHLEFQNCSYCHISITLVTSLFKLFYFYTKFWYKLMKFKRYFLVAYDELNSITYFAKPLQQLTEVLRRLSSHYCCHILKFLLGKGPDIVNQQNKSRYFMSVNISTY